MKTLEEENEELKREFFSTQWFYAESGARLRNNGRLDGLLSVYYEGVVLWPAFQFSQLEVCKEVLKILSDLSDWQIALWFYSGNGWLENGITPMEQLGVDASCVLDAAKRLADPCVG